MTSHMQKTAERAGQETHGVLAGQTAGRFMLHREARQLCSSQTKHLCGYVNLATPGVRVTAQFIEFNRFTSVLFVQHQSTTTAASRCFILWGKHNWKYRQPLAKVGRKNPFLTEKALKNDCMFRAAHVAAIEASGALLKLNFYQSLTADYNIIHLL